MLGNQGRRETFASRNSCPIHLSEFPIAASLGGMEFPTTRLNLVLAASTGEDTQARTALAELCRIYWRPLYIYVRRQGHEAEAAEDLTQSFIARLIEKDALGQFRRERGRFRNFLLASLKNFLANERDSARAQKRGGGVSALPLEQAEETLETARPLTNCLNVNGRSTF